MKPTLLLVLFLLLITCTSPSDSQEPSITEQTKETPPLIVHRDTVYWSDTLVENLEQLEDSVFLKIAYECWKEGEKFEKGLYTSIFQETNQLSYRGFVNDYSFSEVYKLSANHKILLLAMSYGDDAFEVLLLTKDSSLNKWWLSDALTYDTRFVIEKKHLVFDQATGLLFLTVGNFNSDRGDAADKIVCRIKEDRLEDVGSILQSCFFDIDLEWSTQNTSTAPCYAGGLSFCYSDWTVVDKETLQIDYFLKVVMTHKEPYPWPDADTVYMDNISVVFSWQDSLNEFTVNEQQTAAITATTFESLGYGDWNDELIEQLLQKMRQDAQANYFTVPCVKEALLEGRKAKQVF